MPNHHSTMNQFTPSQNGKIKAVHWDDDFFPTLRKSIAAWMVFHGVAVATLVMIYFRDQTFVYYHYFPPAFGFISSFYLIIPAFHRYLGRLYVPILLFILAIFPMFFSYLLAGIESELDSHFQQFLSISRGFPIMLAGVVIGAWIYGFRMVVLLAVITTLIDVIAHWGFNSILNNSDDHLFQIMAIRLASFAMVGFFIAALASHTRAQKQKLQAFNQQLNSYTQVLEELSINKERSRLARELHDTLAHSLTALTVQLEASKAYLDKDLNQSKRLIQSSIDTARSGANETRAALKALRSNQLVDLGLLQALSQSAHQKLPGLAIKLHLPDELPNLEDAWLHCLYRTAQEAMMNIKKHAHASQVEIKLSDDGNELVINDNGSGFDVDTFFESLDLAQLGHFGLQGLLERAELMNAHLTIDSQVGAGCRLRLWRLPSYA